MIREICMVNYGFNMGGVQKVTIELANSFQDLGLDVTLIDFSGKHEFYYDLNENINVPSIINKRTIKRKIIKKFLYVKYNINNKELSVIKLYKEQIEDLIKYLKANKFKYLILCQGLLTAFIPMIKKELPELKVIAWQHNDFKIYTEKYFNEFINEYLDGLKQSDLVVCLTAADVANYKKINRNSCFIYNPLTIKNPRISNLLEKNILFVGRLKIKQKGLDYLIKIAQNLNAGWRIIVAGDGEDREKFKKMIKQHNMENKIILKGSLTSKELLEFYPSGSIFISTSRWEGFGLVITEAMAAGLPIVSFENLGPNEIIDEGRYGILVKDYDIEKFVIELKSLILDQEKRKALQIKSIKRANDFDINKITQEWIERLKLL